MDLTLVPCDEGNWGAMAETGRRTSATRPLTYSGRLGLSVARSTCLAAAGSDTTRKLDTGPVTSKLASQGRLRRSTEATQASEAARSSTTRNLKEGPVHSELSSELDFDSRLRGLILVFILSRVRIFQSKLAAISSSASSDHFTSEICHGCSSECEHIETR